MMIKDNTNFQGHVVQWKESGLSMTANCKARGLNYQSLIYLALCIKKKESFFADSNSFVQIRMPEKISKGIEYHLPNSVYFSFKKVCDLKLIKPYQFEIHPR